MFYPRTLAPGTLADDLEWREIDGAGSLYTFTVARRPTGPPWADAVPQLLAVVQWDAGPRFSTELVDVDPADVRIGMRVSPVFCDVPDTGVTLLRYRPEPAMFETVQQLLRSSHARRHPCGRRTATKRGPGVNISPKQQPRHRF